MINCKNNKCNKFDSNVSHHCKIWGIKHLPCNFILEISYKPNEPSGLHQTGNTIIIDEGVQIKKGKENANKS